MIQVKDRKIGQDYPTFIIGEAGINAGTDLKIAKQLADIAKKAKCDAVKYQTFKTTEINFPNITYKETEELKKYCDEIGITFLSTPHSISAIDFLEPLVPAYKIASSFLTRDYFIRRARVKGKPLIVSTGSIAHETRKANIEEINHFLTLVSNTNLALLYCVSNYPCYNFDIEEFKDFCDTYSSYPVGYSSHSLDINYSLNAVAHGARIIEQHITLDNDFECPDKKVSLVPNQLSELVEEIRKIEGE